MNATIQLKLIQITFKCKFYLSKLYESKPNSRKTFITSKTHHE